jgi:hypothetical protein
MFGGRPKYDDTFGVPMDLGANRKDPITAPPVKRPPLRAARPVEIVETPRRWSDIFRHKDNFELQAEKPAPKSHTPRSENRSFPSQPAQASDEGLRRMEALAANFWKRLSTQHRILLGIVGFWLLISTGLFIPAIIAGIVYLIVRNRNRPQL